MPVCGSFVGNVHNAVRLLRLLYDSMGVDGMIDVLLVVGSKTTQHTHHNKAIPLEPPLRSMASTLFRKCSKHVSTVPWDRVVLV